MLLPFADQLLDIENRLKSQLGRPVLEGIVAQIPESWLESDGLFKNADSHREAYVDYLEHRLGVSHDFVEEANGARAHLI